MIRYMTDASNSGAAIRAYVERVERIHEDRKALGDDVRDVFAEAKGNGFNVPALKTIIRRRAERRKSGDKVDELESIVELYEAAMGAD